MNASDRIRIVESISNKLSKKEWEHISLILREHGYASANKFSGNKFSAVMFEIQYGNDDNKLLNLAKHLKVDLDGIEENIEPSFWEEGNLRIFVSHLAKEKITAIELKETLETFGISSFVAHSDIEPTKAWQHEIELALRTCDCLVALLTDDFNSSKWTDQEIGFAYARNIFIIPVRMGVDPYGFIGSVQAITFHSMSRLADDILTSLLKNNKTTEKISEAIMHKFETSNSWADAKRSWNLMEKFSNWSENLIERFYKARENNSQVRGAYGVPSNIDYYIDRSNKGKKSREAIQ